ncbi:hypothetical protein AB6A40_006644 [Gnathostoma spinigerum]|uniref:Zinc finger C2H2 LYAR-type domain-containing protein n=1 Tax=Gnathostoma spinigerum TaxID=75299 RepID=A0ABD6EUL2_9BILA
MVFFTCNECNEALKKNQVEKHSFRCRRATFSCIDCGKVFTKISYQDHLKCISEDQKYGGKDYVEKAKKGELKQNSWTEQVQMAIANLNTNDTRMKSLLNRILGFGNIPRKETKFINFLQNSFCIRDEDLCKRAWNLISRHEKTSSSASDKSNENGMSARGVVSSSCESNVPNAESSASAKPNNNNNSNPVGNNKKVVLDENGKFKWKKTIKRKLKESPGCGMPLKVLRRDVINAYMNSCRLDDVKANKSELKELFNEKLVSCGAVVADKMVRLSD